MAKLQEILSTSRHPVQNCNWRQS